jgi:hypothetical protein
MRNVKTRVQLKVGMRPGSSARQVRDLTMTLLEVIQRPQPDILDGVLRVNMIQDGAGTNGSYLIKAVLDVPTAREHLGRNGRSGYDDYGGVQDLRQGRDRGNVKARCLERIRSKPKVRA